METGLMMNTCTMGTLTHQGTQAVAIAKPLMLGLGQQVHLGLCLNRKCTHGSKLEQFSLYIILYYIYIYN